MQNIKEKVLNLNIHNLTKDNLKEISANKNALKNFREKCFQKYTELPFFFSRYTKINQFNFKVSYNKQTSRYQIPNDTIQLRCGSESSNQIIFTEIKKTEEKFINFEKYLNKVFKEKENKLEIIAEVLFTNGFFIYVPENLKIKEPLYLKSKELNEQNIFNFNLVVLEKESSLNLIVDTEHSSGDAKDNPELNILGESTYFFLEEGASLNLIKIQNLAENYFNINSNIFYQAKNSKTQFFNFNLGSEIALNFNKCFLQQAGAVYQETQVGLGKNKQNFNMQSKIYHLADNTNGYCQVKIVLEHKAQSSFEGVARINKQIQNADSFISSKSLLLSNQARTNLIPSLEIESGNVQAAHQAAVSKIDEEQLYYLTSRGLSEEESKKILVESFIQDDIDKINIPAVKEIVTKKVLQKLRTKT